jgi:hypothetical protein
VINYFSDFLAGVIVSFFKSILPNPFHFFVSISSSHINSVGSIHVLVVFIIAIPALWMDVPKIKVYLVVYPVAGVDHPRVPEILLTTSDTSNVSSPICIRLPNPDAKFFPGIFLEAF